MSEFRLPTHGEPKPRRLIGASQEAIAHHADQHPCTDTGPGLELPCPCGRTITIYCPACIEPVFVVALTYDQCEHLAELVGESGALK